MTSDLMRVVTIDGVRDLAVTDPDERSVAGSHWNAVTHYLETGEFNQLTPFRGVKVAGNELETDPDVLDVREDEGSLDIDHIYPGR